MQIAVLGATGATGRELVVQALDAGHEVRALVRDVEQARASLPESDRLTLVPGDARDPAALAGLVAGTGAVISALGPRRGDARLHRDVGPLLTAAALEHGVDRVVAISGAGTDVPGDRKGPVDRAVSWLLHRVGGGMAQDKEAEREAFERAGLRWTAVRPPRIVDRAPRGPLRHDPHRPQGLAVSRTALATFLLDQATDTRYVGAAPFVAD